MHTSTRAHLFFLAQACAAGLALAEPAGRAPSPQGATPARTPLTRSELRLALEQQREARTPAPTAERRLNEAERAELRRQLREQSLREQAARDSGDHSHRF